MPRLVLSTESAKIYQRELKRDLDSGNLFFRHRKIWFEINIDRAVYLGRTPIYSLPDGDLDLCKLVEVLDCKFFEPDNKPLH